MQAWIEGLEYRLGPLMPAKPNDERCVTRCHRECSFLPPEVQPPMLLPGPIAGFLVEQHAATKTAIPSIKLRRCTADIDLQLLSTRRPLDFAYDSLGIRVVGVHKYANYLRLWHKFVQKLELLGLHS